jgi:hypothetical protein
MSRSEPTLSTTLVGLLYGFDDTDSDRLPHVTDGEATERWVFVISLNTHGLCVHSEQAKQVRSKHLPDLRGNEFDNASIARFDAFGVGFHSLTSPAINLLEELSELASDVGSVTIQDGCVASGDLTRVIQDNDLSIEGSRLLRWVVLGVGSHITTTNVLDRYVPEREVINGRSAKIEVTKTNLTLKPTLSPGLPCSSCS